MCGGGSLSGGGVPGRSPGVLNADMTVHNSQAGVMSQASPRVSCLDQAGDTS